MNIGIRSMELFPSGEVYYHAGGGIVFDSRADKEYEEVLLKASKLIKSS